MLAIFFKYINYKLTSYTEHDIHSPFVYELYMELIKNKYQFNDFNELDQIRKQLLNDYSIIEVNDFGAGSKISNTNRRTIKSIAKYGISQKKQSEFLYRLMNKYNPKVIVELGTSIGLTSMYLAKASQKANIYTIEGCVNLCQFSQKLFQKNNIKNIHTINGNFDIKFSELLSQLDTIDVLYIDGNHTYTSTINYFKTALTKKNNKSIFIVDDINWSSDMQQAWKEIHHHPDVSLSIDFFSFGLIFFRSEQKQKEHFVLNF